MFAHVIQNRTIVKIILISFLSLSAMLHGCKNEPIPALHTTIENGIVEGFVYTNSGYFLIYNNNDKDANHFKLSIKADKSSSPVQIIFPLSLRDTLFASNLIYSCVGKEGVSWLLFDKTEGKKNSPKRYKLIKYDFLRRVTEKTYFILPIAGRDFSSISDLQVDEKQEVVIYIDNAKKDIVSLNIKDGTFKSFSPPIQQKSSIVSQLIGDSLRGPSEDFKYKIALNLNNSTLYIINKKIGMLYSVPENYVIQKQFYNKDIQSQVIEEEGDLEDVVDIDFDYKSRPIVATKRSIYIVRNRDKTALVKNFRYGDIIAISYACNRVYFCAKSAKATIYSIALTK